MELLIILHIITRGKSNNTIQSSGKIASSEGGGNASSDGRIAVPTKRKNSPLHKSDVVLAPLEEIKNEIYNTKDDSNTNSHFRRMFSTEAFDQIKNIVLQHTYM